MGDLDVDGALEEAIAALHGDDPRRASCAAPSLGGAALLGAAPRRPQAAGRPPGRRRSSTTRSRSSTCRTRSTREVERIEGAERRARRAGARSSAPHERAHVKAFQRGARAARRVKRPRFDFRGATESRGALPPAPRSRSRTSPWPPTRGRRRCIQSRAYLVAGAGHPLGRGPPRGVDPAAWPGFTPAATRSTTPRSKAEHAADRRRDEASIGHARHAAEKAPEIHGLTRRALAAPPCWCVAAACWRRRAPRRAAGRRAGDRPRPVAAGAAARRLHRRRADSGSATGAHERAGRRVRRARRGARAARRRRAGRSRGWSRRTPEGTTNLVPALARAARRERADLGAGPPAGAAERHHRLGPARGPRRLRRRDARGSWSTASA